MDAVVSNLQLLLEAGVTSNVGPVDLLAHAVAELEVGRRLPSLVAVG